MPPVYSEVVAPFRFLGEDVACLLLHGLTGTPFEVRELGEHLHAEGFTVSGPLLTGHATDDWRDLAQATWRDWVHVAESEYQRLALEHDRIVIIGDPELL